MGLSIEIGVHSQSTGDDPEHLAYAQAQITAINKAMTGAGLPPYVEPESLDPAAVWSGDMYGYSGLHYLRRIAAHIDAGKPLPPPGNDDASKDPVLAAYYEAATAEPPSFVQRLFGKAPPFKRAFDHLILHSDAEGYYLPNDFRDVVFPEPNTVAGDMIGSAARLQVECQRLAQILEIPPDLDADSDELWDAASGEVPGQSRWQNYGVESFTCLRLLRAATASLASRGAIVFC